MDETPSLMPHRMILIQFDRCSSEIPASVQLHSDSQNRDGLWPKRVPCRLPQTQGTYAAHKVPRSSPSRTTIRIFHAAAAQIRPAHALITDTFSVVFTGYPRSSSCTSVSNLSVKWYVTNSNPISQPLKFNFAAFIVPQNGLYGKEKRTGGSKNPRLLQALRSIG